MTSRDRDDFFLRRTLGLDFEALSAGLAEEDDPEPPRLLAVDRTVVEVLVEPHDCAWWFRPGRGVGVGIEGRRVEGEG